MKHKYIRINDISEINISRVSVYDMNNRYIDKTGTMFGLRYNRNEKKIEIIKILRAHQDEIHQIQQKVIRTKLGKERDDAGVAPKQEESEPAGRDEEFFDPEQYITETIAVAMTHRQRIKAIINNIKNSNAISKDNKIESGNLEEILRVLENDSYFALENLDAYQKELQSYPRSLSFYQSKMDKKGRIAIDKLSGENKKAMRYVYLSEMQGSIRTVYTKLLMALNSLLEFLEKKDPEEMKNLTPPEKQSYNDAIVSTKNTITEVDALLGRCGLIDDHLTKLAGV